MPTPGRTSALSSEVKLHQISRILEVSFSDGRAFKLPCEFLRVYSPTAEVRGHGPGQEVLQVGKRDVAITKVEAVGNYAVQLTFSDGHDAGMYSGDRRYDYGVRQHEMRRQHLKRLKAAGACREAAATNP